MLVNVCMERVARLRLSSRWLLRANGRVTVNIGQSSNSRGATSPQHDDEYFANYLSILLNWVFCSTRGCSCSKWDKYFANYFCQLALPPDHQPIRREIIRHAFSREQLERGGKLSPQSAIIQLLLDQLHPALRQCNVQLPDFVQTVLQLPASRQCIALHCNVIVQPPDFVQTVLQLPALRLCTVYLSGLVAAAKVLQDFETKIKLNEGNAEQLAFCFWPPLIVFPCQ